MELCPGEHEAKLGRPRVLSIAAMTMPRKRLIAGSHHIVPRRPVAGANGLGVDLIGRLSNLALQETVADLRRRSSEPPPNTPT